MTAWFLTEEEKVRVVKRVRVNQNGIETKVWKKHQFIEAITDVKTWIFFFYAGITYVKQALVRRVTHDVGTAISSEEWECSTRF